MNRRDFLKFAGLGTLSLGFGSTAFRLGWWWDQNSADNYEVLSDDESKISAAVVDAMFPGDGAEDGLPNGLSVGAVEEFDAYLAGVDEKTANFLRLLLHAIDDMAIPVDFGMSRFRDRSREERIDILKAWDNSSLHLRRSAFRGLKFALALGYCHHPDVMNAAGIAFSCGGT